MQEAVEAKIYDLQVDSAEMDDEAVANEFCAQFAANLNATPCWYYRKPDDAAVQELSSRVFDAYYGEEDPNFCFEFGAMLRFDEPESSLGGRQRHDRTVRRGRIWRLLQMGRRSGCL